VLLKNDGNVLPLAPTVTSIAVIGPDAVEARLGGYSGPGTARVSILDGLRERLGPHVTVRHAPGPGRVTREFAVVPASAVLDADGYKALYNRELQALVARRLSKLERGELCVDDYTLKGALPMLQALHAAGVKLHLASGTDEVDLLEEAKALGHAALFEGRIHGAVGDVSIEAKKVVLEKILSEISAKEAGSLVTFGDGPVEIRETKRRGGYAIGVASDEIRRFGANPRKRTRVIRAGADLVVPDFSQWKTLLPLLGVSP
jgi:phosphoglycolate phosphatase-like HAD superfamily hydrolase